MERRTPEEKVITLTEFKTIVESFRSEQRAMGEAIKHGLDSLKEQVASLTVGQTLLQLGQKKLEYRQAKLEGGQKKLEADISDLKAGQARLEKGQVEIKAELKRKVSVDEFEVLKKRVHKLERRIA